MEFSKHQTNGANYGDFAKSEVTKLGIFIKSTVCAKKLMKIGIETMKSVLIVLCETFRNESEMSMSHVPFIFDNSCPINCNCAFGDTALAHRTWIPI